jgi:hypothetical protein
MKLFKRILNSALNFKEKIKEERKAPKTKIIFKKQNIYFLLDLIEKKRVIQALRRESINSIHSKEAVDEDQLEFTFLESPKKVDFHFPEEITSINSDPNDSRMSISPFPDIDDAANLSDTEISYKNPQTDLNSSTQEGDTGLGISFGENLATPKILVSNPEIPEEINESLELEISQTGTEENNTKIEEEKKGEEKDFNLNSTEENQISTDVAETIKVVSKKRSSKDLQVEEDKKAQVEDSSPPIIKKYYIPDTKPNWYNNRSQRVPYTQKQDSYQSRSHYQYRERHSQYNNTSHNLSIKFTPKSSYHSAHSANTTFSNHSNYSNPSNFTHFLSIPLNLPSFQHSYQDLQDSIASTVPHLPKQLFASPKTLHLTILMLSLSDKHKLEKAVSVLQKSLQDILKVLDQKSLVLSFRSLAAMTKSRNNCENLRQTRVLYSKVAENEYFLKLKEICNVLITAMLKEGVVLESELSHVEKKIVEDEETGESRIMFYPEKFHLTLMNSTFCKKGMKFGFDSSRFINNYWDLDLGNL